MWGEWVHLDLKVFFLIWEDSCMLWDIWLDFSSCSLCITILVSMATPLPLQTSTCRQRESRQRGCGRQCDTEHQSVSEKRRCSLGRGLAFTHFSVSSLEKFTAVVFKLNGDENETLYCCRLRLGNRLFFLWLTIQIHWVSTVITKLWNRWIWI